MGDADGGKVEQAAEHLVGQDFELEAGHFRLVFVLLQRFVEVGGEVVHYHVEVLLLSLIAVETVLDLEDVGVVQRFQNLQLPVFVFFVLEHSLYSNCL